MTRISGLVWMLLGFSKNNEYFNDIADGYTLFGYHLNPKLVYFPAEFIRIEAGALLWKDFGTNNYNQVRPTFTIKLQKPNIISYYSVIYRLP